jgi:enoyl-CoA hydratase/carnithine racemase
MNSVDMLNEQISDGIATITLQRGKVNALNEQLVDELRHRLESLEKDSSVRSVILTGKGKFFSFGLDIPELYDYSRESFAEFLRKFTSLYTRLFVFPKPVIAAINGHAIAGGCMLASACDCRLMVTGKAKISLNEITFGSSVFAGSVEMLTYAVGSRNAETMLCSGAMYPAEDAARFGLVDKVVSEDALQNEARQKAEEMAGKSAAAFRSIKLLLRGPVAKAMETGEAASIREFVDIWYSPATRAMVKNIQIRG